MNDKLIIRKMSKSDFEYWMPISIRLQANEKHFANKDTPLEEYIERLENQLVHLGVTGHDSKKHYFYSLDYDTNKNIGFVWFGEYPEFPEKVILLFHIYVKEEYRGKKIASDALNELHKQIFNEGYNEIYLNVSKSNFAYNLYKSLGYKVFREFETNYHMSLKR